MDLNSIIKISFSKVLKNYRLNAGISQKELSERAGLHRNEIGLLERKLRAPSIETIIKIANGLNLPPKKLFDEFLNELGSVL